MKKNVLLNIMLLLLASITYGQIKVDGEVRSASDQQTLAGAVIRLKDDKTGTLSDANGKFSLAVSDTTGRLIVSYIGYITQEVRTGSGNLVVMLEPNSSELNEVIVSTGYQQIPAERATGSFAFADNKLLNRRVSPDVLTRISDVVPGVIFNKGRSNALRIRGQSTIFAEAEPLIVIDNFPYEGDLNSINPNDVESITVLKDAAAASIWGARAGNGVIVITTKKGSFKKPLQLSFNSNLTIAAKPDLFYQPAMSGLDYTDVETRLFGSGYFRADETSINKVALSPVVELLIKNRDGILSDEALSSQIADLSKYDFRNDLSKYVYRKSVNQQYALSLTSGTEHQKLRVALGHDRNLGQLVGNGYQRTSLHVNNTLQLLENKLRIATDIYHTNSRQENNGTDRFVMNSNQMYPYARLADENGNPVALPRDLRESFTDQATASGLLPWEYVPLAELELSDNQSKLTNYRFNADISYRVWDGLTIQGLYQYGVENNSLRNLQNQESYFARNMINRFTQVNTNGSLTRNVPYGAILDMGNSTALNHNARLQLNYGKSLAEHHRIDAIAGSEIRDRTLKGNNTRHYGYNDDYASVRPVDYVRQFPGYVQGFNTNIPNMDRFTETFDRFVSFYSNLAYSYKNRYALTASARLDKSNLFGVATNQKGVPLYSVGSSWEISQEKFYDWSAMPYLRLRATLGCNGNIDRTVSAYTTARGGSTDITTRLPYAQIVNPPNPQLRWERIKMINIGLDFASLNRRISGSLEYFTKSGIDLIGSAPMPPSSGVVTFRGNNANTTGRGFDLVINSQNITGAFQWDTHLLVSHAKDIVTSYDVKATSQAYAQGGDNMSSGALPMVGRPLMSVYAYRFGGLDPENGNPIGFLNGATSQEYNNIITSTQPEDLIYFGPARPTLFGSVRNQFSYKGFSLSAMLNFRSGYYFRRNSIRYGLNQGLSFQHGDYGLRWQQPGDEKHTSVPSLPSTGLVTRDNVYILSEALVEKADHIRLRDVQFSYDFTKRLLGKMPLRNLQFYVYADNLGIIWKASKTSLDPDYAFSTFVPSRTLSIGVKADF
jgi:TonB-linked SusC/RagA family outer membrane protein